MAQNFNLNCKRELERLHVIAYNKDRHKPEVQTESNLIVRKHKKHSKK